MLYGKLAGGSRGPREGSYCSSLVLVVLQTRVVWPVFESITVFTGRHLQVTVLAFSCLTTTQCSMSSAVGGGISHLDGAYQLRALLPTARFELIEGAKHGFMWENLDRAVSLFESFIDSVED